jgi:holo-[acyl-carrier protein] synthase
VIVAVGIDIVEVNRIRTVMGRTPRFTNRVFTQIEQEYCNSKNENVSHQHYAARFAAKEAGLKALRTGWTGGISWKDIEVRHEESGAPYLIFSGKALEVLKSLGATTHHVSLSHTAEHAVAVVIIEKA